MSENNSGFFYFKFITNLLCIHKIPNPKTIEAIISILFKTPSTVNDILIKIVDIINPEFLITL
jgi:hypothetical protein